MATSRGWRSAAGEAVARHSVPVPCSCGLQRRAVPCCFSTALLPIQYTPGYYEFVAANVSCRRRRVAGLDSAWLVSDKLSPELRGPCKCTEQEKRSSIYRICADSGISSVEATPKAVIWEP